jgi:hypothetical protein
MFQSRFEPGDMIQFVPGEGFKQRRLRSIPARLAIKS